MDQSISVKADNQKATTDENPPQVITVPDVSPQAMVDNPSPVASSMATASPVADAMMAKSSTKEFTVVAANFKYNQKELRVKKGDTVKITLDNSEGMHDLVIDEFGVKTSRIAAGKQETVSFVANKAGSFEFYCSVGNHRQMGMKGMLIVE